MLKTLCLYRLWVCCACRCTDTTLSGMNEWHKLRLNKSKTDLLHFRACPGVSRSHRIRCEGRSIAKSESLKFLDLTVGLRFEKDSMELECELCPAYLRRRNLRSIVKINIFRIFYFSCVESSLRYTLVFWALLSSAKLLQSLSHSPHCYVLNKKKIIKR